MSDLAYAKINHAIVSNVLPPGARINEMEISLQLGMSRTPVREALYRLERQGLVEPYGKRGVRVSLIRPEELKEVYEILAALECQAAAGLASATQKERKAPLAEMVAALEGMRGAIHAGDLSLWSNMDGKFHSLILENCGNERLAKIATAELDIGRRTRTYTLHRRTDLEISMQEHQDVLTAIQHGDPDAARNAMYRHRTRAAGVIIGLLQRPLEF